MKIRICHHEFEFTEVDVDPSWHNGMGRTNLAMGTLKLRAGMSPGVRESTILHEVIHLIAGMNDLKTVDENDTIVSVLAVGLLDFLRSNPELARQICGE